MRREKPMKTNGRYNKLDGKVLHLKILRTYADLTQAELAKMAGISRKAYSLIESGESSPSLEHACMICKALGITDINEVFPIDWDAIDTSLKH